MKKKGIPFKLGGMGELRISSRSTGMRGAWQLVTDKKRVLIVDRGKTTEADDGYFFSVPIDRNYCQRLLRV